VETVSQSRGAEANRITFYKILQGGLGYLREASPSGPHIRGFVKGHLEIGKPAPVVPTYLVLSGKKSARSPPAEIFNSKTHAKTHEPPFKTAENRPEITETPAGLQQNGRRHIQNSNFGLLIGWCYSSNLPTSF
jgi:hypothetical protein